MPSEGIISGLVPGTSYLGQGRQVPQPIAATPQGDLSTTAPGDVPRLLDVLVGIRAEMQEMRRLFCTSKNLIFREIDNQSTG